MQVRRTKQQRQHTRSRLVGGEPELSQEAKREERGQAAEKHIGAITDHNAADARVITVVILKERQPLQPGTHEVGRPHQQGLAHTKPSVESAASAVNAEFRVFIGKDRWLRGPEGVGRLQAVHGVARAELARLHDQCGQAGGEAQQPWRIREPAVESRRHIRFMVIEPARSTTGPG